MDKFEYFLKAIQNGAYQQRDWVLSIFSVSMEEEDAWAKNPYPYRLIVKNDQCYFIDPDQHGDHTLITGYVANQPLLRIKDRIKLKPKDLPNVKTPIETNLGNVVFNAIAVIWPFNDAIDFLTGRVNGKALNKLVVSRLRDNPDPAKGEVSVEQLLRYGEAMGALAGFTQICVPAATPKTLTVSPEVIKLRNELLEKHKHELNNPVVIANIEKQLVALDKEWFKDDPASGFLISGKSFDIVRKKMFITMGLEGGFGGPSEMTFIPNSLNEGWDIEKLPAMADSLRFGSYNRGALTALGGESVKYFHRVFQNTKIAETDCGDMVGIPWLITPSNQNGFDGLYRIDGKSLVRLTDDSVKSLLGKTIRVRSPMTCKTQGTSFCERCMGDNLSRTPTSLLINASNVGSKFMTTFLASAHGKALKTHKLNVDEQFT